MTPTKFRLLAAASLIVPFIGAIVDYVRFPDPEAKPPTLDQWPAIGGSFVFLVANVIVIVGLWRFSRWARPAVVAMTAVSIALLAVGGSYETDAIAEAIYEVGTLLAGATIAAAYWSQVSTLFERP